MPTSRFVRASHLKRVGRAALLCLVLAIGGCGGKVPYEGKSASELEAMLHTADPTTQAQGAYGLSLLGAEARTAVPALIEALAGNETLVRAQAALALGRIGPDAGAAVPALAELLRDPEWTVRRQVALALGRIGPQARLAIPALEKLGDDPDHLVRQAAEEALQNIRK
jgi:HEAT repeat protein